MTTNKPEAKRFNPAYSVDSVMRGHLFMEECEHGAWVSLEGYEALQAECEKLRKDAERYRHIRDRLTAPTFDNLFFLELYSAGAFDHPDDVDEAVDDAMQEDA